MTVTCGRFSEATVVAVCGHLALHFSLAACSTADTFTMSSFFTSPIASLTNLRNLASTNEEWVRPPNPEGNYSSWKSQLDDRLSSTCIKFDDSFESGVKVAEAEGLKALFDTLRGTSSLSAFEDLVRSDFADSQSSAYTKAKAAWIAFISVGGVVLIFALIMFGSFSHCFRRRCGKSCRCCLSTRSTSKADPQQPMFAPLVTPALVAVFLVGFMLSFAIVCSVNTAKFSNGVYATFCDGYLSMKGYFFGTSAVQPGPDMVADWKGAHNQWSEMHALKVKVTPGAGNPMTSLIKKKYKVELRPHLTNATTHHQAEIKKIQTVVKDLKRVTDTLASDLLLNEKGTFSSTPNYAFPTSKLTLFFSELADYKLAEYSDKLQQSLDKGITLIEENIEKYGGKDSLLFAEAEASVENALMSLDDVNYSLAGLVAELAHAQDSLEVSLTVSRAALALWASLAFVLLIFGTVVYVFLIRAHWRGDLPAKPLLPGLCALYVCASLFGAISLIASGILFLVGNVGGDACNLISTTLMQQGDWQTLPTRLWNETLHGTTDMMSVLDTCVRSDGHGDIAATLGLSGSMRQLEETLQKTKDEIRKQAVDVLQLEEKIEDTRSMHRLMNYTAFYIWPYRDTDEVNYIDEDVSDVGFKTGTRYVTVQALDPWTEPITVVCLIPAMAMTNALEILRLCGDNFISNVIGTGTLVDIITAKAAKYADKNLTNVKTKWCMASLNNDPNYSAKCAEDAVVIDAAWPLKNELYNKVEVAATRDAIKAAKGETEARKWMDAVYTAVQMEKVSTHQISVGGTSLECPKGTTECTLHELLPEVNKMMLAFGAALVQNAEDTAALVNNFVEEVTIGSMESLLRDARDALDHFNCQFVGTSLTHGMSRGLCLVAMPNVAMLALSGSMFFAACLVVSIITWFNWNHVRLLYKVAANRHRSHFAQLSNDAGDDADKEEEEGAVLSASLECSMPSGDRGVIASSRYAPSQSPSRAVSQRTA